MESKKLEENLKILNSIQERTGVKILHTLKSFNKKEGLEIISKHLGGFSIGNPQELKSLDSIDYRYIHSYSPAFKVDELEAIASSSNSMSFNSLAQWERYAYTCSKECSVGLRINPELTLNQPRYCDPNISLRLGVTHKEFMKSYTNDQALFKNLEGLHLHALCSQDADGLRYLLSHIKKNYLDILPQLRWINLGGGHKLTHSKYDTGEFIYIIDQFSSLYPNIEIIFEPGDSVVNNTGFFRTTILDIIPAKIPIVILDTSIETHLLDIAITKQKPKVQGTSSQQTPYPYLLSGMSCIAGDVMGEYYFDKKLQVNDRIIFENMMSYTIVKQTEFNGIEKASFKLL
jgi:carboxynorspermidine decarboxylase